MCDSRKFVPPPHSIPPKEEYLKFQTEGRGLYSQRCLKLEFPKEGEDVHVWQLGVFFFVFLV